MKRIAAALLLLLCFATPAFSRSDGFFNTLQEPNDVAKTKPTNTQVLAWNSGTGLWTPTTPSDTGLAITSGKTLTVQNNITFSGTDGVTMNVTNNKVASIGITVDGGGSTITTGVKGYITIPYAATITGWDIAADGVNPTCTFDVWKIATGTALPTVTNTIMGTKPALSTGNVIHSTTMTSWSTLAVAAGDIIGFNVDAVTVATKITFQIEVSKT